MTEVHLHAVGFHHDALELVTEAISSGRYSEDERRRTHQESVAVSEQGRFRADLAYLAAQACYTEYSLEPQSVALALHCVAFSSGVEIWNSGAYVARRVGASPRLASEINAASNGALVAMDLASSYIRKLPWGTTALITTADSWSLPDIDRWRADRGLVLGDAGTAMVLSRERGLFQVLAICSRSDPHWEALHRGTTAPQAPREYGYRDRSRPIDLSERASRFFADGEVREAFFASNRANIRDVFDEALGEAGLRQSDIERYVLPFFGEGLVRVQCADALGIDLDQTTAAYGLRIGHTGAGDQVAGLTSLLSDGELSKGSKIALVGVGAGFTWTTAIVEYTGAPPPQPSMRGRCTIS
jgi:3-oxoacyl-[acyl-carrier-protein] synthase-3